MMGVTNHYLDASATAAGTSLNTNVSHFATGDDDTTPTDDDTTLNKETYREALFDTDQKTYYIEFQSYQDSTENNTNSIKEAGLFDAGAAGNCYAHALTNNISKTSSVEVFLGFRITFEVTQT